MNLYDIHTHSWQKNPQTGFNVINIINTTPATYSAGATDTFCSCGIHPWDTAVSEKNFTILEKIISDANVVAIGEAGLDNLRGGNIASQENIFRRQIELAEKYEKPLIIHCVKAWDRLLSLHKEYSPVVPWIVHGFRGKPQQAEQMIHSGMKLSFGEYYNLQTVSIIPSDSLFLETDTASVSIHAVYQSIAETKKLSIQELAKIVEQNVKRDILSHIGRSECRC